MERKLQGYFIQLDPAFFSNSYHLYVWRYDRGKRYQVKFTTTEIFQEEMEPATEPSIIIPKDTNLLKDLVECIQQMGYFPKADQATIAHLEDLRTLLGLQGNLNIEHKISK